MGETSKKEAERLRVCHVDFLKPKNEKDHNTSLYENLLLIVRRAATFDLDILFINRDYVASLDDLTLNFSTGSEPSEALGTKIVCPIAEKAGGNTAWNCSVVESADKKLGIRVNVPADSIVTRFSVTLDILSGTKDGTRTKYTHGDKSIIVIFNPFAKDDDVYMADENKRKEYVMNDYGILYRGSYSNIEGLAWYYSQFDEGVLDNVLQMIQNDLRHLEQPMAIWRKYNDPVYVSRVLSAMVNSDDDKGVLQGKWDGNYDGERSPSYWSDSAKILKKWADNGMKSVKYGQCWVFAGVLATALRAIGIPARCITNFTSAHDTNANVTVDMYYDADSGEKLDEKSDSVWNFHVWNEAYFTRPDLPQGYDGWQVVDATPQENSAIVGSSLERSLFQCGPAPVKAIKEGNIDIGYDSNFIFGEVNADRVDWIVRNGETQENPDIKKRFIGKNISTKSVGAYDRIDITNEYKFPEGTKEEREAFNRARKIVRENVLIEPKFEIKIIQKDEIVLVGSKLATTIKVKNISDAKSTVSINVAGSTKRHAGSIHASIKKISTIKILKSGEVEKFLFEIEMSEYRQKIVDNKVINIRVMVTDSADGNTKVKELDVVLKMPDCVTTTIGGYFLPCGTYMVLSTFPPGVTTKFDIVFENKFSITLTNLVLEVNFRGNKMDNLKFDVNKSICPGEKHILKDIKVLPLENWSGVYISVESECTEIKGF